MKQRISLKEATRAMYVDFEGVMDAAPVLLGAFWVDDAQDEHFVQYVFDQTLESAARAKSIDDDGACVYVGSLHEALAELCETAEQEDRLLVEWSVREEDAVREAHVDGRLQRCFSERVRNALPIARRWKNRLHPGFVFPRDKRGKSNTLRNFMSFTGMPVPSYLAPAASRIREVTRQIEKRGSYDAITPVAKAKWTKLLNHNEWDCRGTRHVLIAACDI